MTISSRTPEGQHNHCPVCDSEITIEPSVFFGDAPCPNCGNLLWFISSLESHRFYKRSDSEITRSRVVNIVAKQLGVDRRLLERNPQAFVDIGADSLDTVELVMEIEEELYL